MGLVFHKLHITQKIVGAQTISYVYKKYLKDIPWSTLRASVWHCFGYP